MNIFLLILTFANVKKGRFFGSFKKNIEFCILLKKYNQTKYSAISKSDAEAAKDFLSVNYRSINLILTN